MILERWRQIIQSAEAKKGADHRVQAESDSLKEEKCASIVGLIVKHQNARGPQSVFNGLNYDKALLVLRVDGYHVEGDKIAPIMKERDITMAGSEEGVCMTPGEAKSILRIALPRCEALERLRILPVGELVAKEFKGKDGESVSIGRGICFVMDEAFYQVAQAAEEAVKQSVPASPSRF